MVNKNAADVLVAKYAQREAVSLALCAVCGAQAQPAIELGPTTKHPGAKVCAGCLVFAVTAAIDGAVLAAAPRKHHKRSKTEFVN